jgi:hypothetical protein
MRIIKLILNHFASFSNPLTDAEMLQPDLGDKIQ